MKLLEFGEASGVALFRELGARGFRRMAVLGTNRESFEFTRIFPAHARYLTETKQLRVPLVCRVPEEAADAEYDAAIRILLAAEKSIRCIGRSAAESEIQLSCRRILLCHMSENSIFQLLITYRFSLS